MPKGMGQGRGRGMGRGQGCGRAAGQGPQCEKGLGLMGGRPRGLMGEGCRYGYGPFGCEGQAMRGGGMRRMGRLFDHGAMRLLVLMMIAEKPRHGYEIIKSIEDKVGGAYAPSPGLIYPTLTLLEEMGFVSAATADNKKLYSLTPEGQAHLAENEEKTALLKGKMEEAKAAQGALPPPELIRAMENLRLALRLRLSRGAMEPAQAQSIAATMDALALQVEKA